MCSKVMIKYSTTPQKWSHRKTQRITNCKLLQQPRRKTLAQNACSHDQHSDSHWWHQSASHRWLRKPSLILVDHRVKVIEGCYGNVMLL